MLTGQILMKDTIKCMECQQDFKARFKSDKRKFCSRSCSAKFNNRGLCRNGKSNMNLCKHCSGSMLGKPKVAKFCSEPCGHAFKLESRIKSGKFSAITAKTWLTKTNKNCFVCNLSTWNDKPIPLELDHIDGNSTNNILTNLRLICPNCHAQTSTYKGKNRGNGRHSRMVRYHQGKSF